LPTFIVTSGEQHRGEATSPGERRLIGRPPSLEERHELLAGLLLAPTTVAGDDFKEVVGGGLAIAARVLDEGQIEAGLVVLRIGRDARLQRRRIAEGTGLLGKVEPGADRHDFGGVGVLFRHRGKGEARGGEIVHGKLAGGQPDKGADRLRSLGERGGEMLGRAGDVLFAKKAVTFLDERFGLARARRSGKALDERLDLALRYGADETVHRLAVLEGDHRGDRLDAELAGDGGMVVDVHLDQPHGTLGIGHRLLDDRRQGLARPAPGGPEIDQNGLAA
jgi:hypothetical protein